MRILKNNSILKLMNSYLIDASQPSNISYLWNFGSLLAVCLVIQIVTGVTLAMHFSPSILEAFNSVEHIINNNGLIIFYILGLLLFITIIQFKITRNNNLSLTRSNYSTKVKTQLNHITYKLNPWFITGFVDAEGSFSIIVIKDPRYKAGYRVEAIFSIALHKKDVAILENIQNFFEGAGKIKFETKRDVVSYVIRSKDQLSKILIPHFDSFPLITQKRADYLLFKQGFELIYNGAHLTSEGLIEILAIKSNLNLGLPSKLKEEFPNLPLIYRPLVLDSEIPTPHWIAGFTSGEGSFYVNISESSSTKSGSQVQLFFYISQHIRDKDLLVKFISYFGVGRYHPIKGKGWASYECNKFSDIITKIIPFFKEYPIEGIKHLDFESWCQIAKMVDTKEHLTPEGLAKIIKIKNSMNNGRVLDNQE
uniref:Cytochrome b n=1 Tax=Esteya vermicola TaxID=522482 RepID=A0A1Z1GDQ1_9PEZI|nr:cytochrome b [Esteya vermicola]ARV88381.1 cytochrome b [Esteya vermicola]